MNNIKKAALGILVAGLAFGFSAFTTIKQSSIVRYYKVSTTYPEPNNPGGYSYYSGDRCEPAGVVCSAKWNIGLNTVPTVDGTPLPTTGVSFVNGSITAGHFE
nr:hypothetical protein [uncultured Pedobacter sp.]